MQDIAVISFVVCLVERYQPAENKRKPYCFARRNI
jgi:hypothetical protein